MKQTLKKLTLTAALSLAASLASAATAYTEPVGAVSITCLAASDTFISVPFAKAAEFQGAATAIDATSGVITTSGLLPNYVGVTTGTSPNFVISSPYYYVRFTSGFLNGRYYTITANTAIPDPDGAGPLTDTTTITVDKNGENWTGVSNTDTFKIVKYWTLADLFPVANQIPFVNTLADYTSGRACVISNNNFTNSRRTEIFLPNNTGVGTNLASPKRFFLKSGGWFNTAGTFAAADNEMLVPDSYFILRNPSTVLASTSLVASGSVDMGNNVFTLATRIGGAQDNYVGFTRPKDTTLAGLNLSATDFVDSANNFTSGTNRKDELFLYSNTPASINRAPSKRYFRVGGQWRDASGFADSNAVVIPAGAAFFIRKVATVDGAVKFYSNTPNY
jgi:uncharacterized protein (TIGR02597 family)